MRHRYLSLLALILLTLTTASAQVGMLDPACWIAMEPVDTVVTPLIHAPFVKKALGGREVGQYKLPVFRRDFTARSNVKRATLYVCGLGHFNVYLDGVKVGDHFLDPGWTLYDKEALYVAFDVTDHFLRLPDNVLAEFAQRWKRNEHELRVELGNGFYNVPKGRYNKVVGTYGQPKLRLRLQLEYKTGQDDNILTDSKWEVSEGQITYSSIYGGEDVDLRRQYHWQPVLNLWYDGGPQLRPQQGTEVVVLNNYRPTTMWRAENGDWVYDMGQNMSGIMQAKLQGKAGQEVQFIPAELRGKDGQVSNKHQGNWQYRVTLGGTEAVTVEPKFSYTGFRYIQVHGAVPAGESNPEGLPVIEELITHHTSNVACREEAGTFTCNSDYLNQVHRIIDWAIRSNLQSIPTDCPHREKLGWLEQDHLMQPSMYYRYDLTNLYRQLMQDMEDSQFTQGQTLGLGAPSTPWINEGHDLEGMIPTIAPYYTNFGWNFDDTPEWGAAFIISPWYHYEWTGSDELFREHYAAMERYIDYLTRRARTKGYILDYGLGDWYDLGPKKPGYAQLTTQGVTATATYYYMVRLMAQMARVLSSGEGLDTSKEISAEGWAVRNSRPKVTSYSSIEMLGTAKRYDALADSIRAAYNQRFLHLAISQPHNLTTSQPHDLPSVYYDRNSQTANAISLYMGLVPDEYRGQVLQSLVDDIEGRIAAIDQQDTTRYEWGDNGPTVITAGDVGFRYVLQALAEGGRNDVIWDMTARDDVPGYGMQLKKGATALTESWQALENVSNNHLMLGHILEWMYGYVGGIRQRPGTKGWEDIIIAPHPVGDITDCTVTYRTPKGPLKVHWWIEDQTCKIQYTAPRSAKVEVINPAAEMAARMQQNMK